MASKLLPLLTWRSALCDSGLTPTTRHVALTLSLYMNERGGSAFPGAMRLAHDTGLSERRVREHLGVLVHAGWLELVERGGMKGETRRANAYQARIPLWISTPDGVSPVTETTVTPDGDDTDPCHSVTPSLQELSKNSRNLKSAAEIRADWYPEEVAPMPESLRKRRRTGLSALKEESG